MKLLKIKKLNKERGSATVEAIISFTGFLFVIFTILNIINFCRAQMLISNAVDTATKEITQYSYFYKMSGLQKFSDDISANAEQGKTNLNDVIGTVGDLYSSIGTAADNTAEHAANIKNAVEEGNVNLNDVQNTLAGIKTDGTNIETSINSVMSAFDSVQDNPLLYMKSIIAVAGNESLDLLKSHVIAAPLARSFTAKHFGKTTAEANSELKKLGVVDGLDGMNFKMSTVFSSDAPEDVHIVVYYRLKIVQIFGWTTLEVPMCKESVARAWLGGDDVQKVVTPMVPATPEEETTEGEETKTEEDGETTEEETTEKVDTTNSYWHLSDQDRYNAVLTGQYSNEIGRDFLHYYKTVNGVPCAQEATPDLLKADNPKLLSRSYTITKPNDKINNNIYINVIGELNNIGLYLEANDGGQKVDRNFVYEIYVPENISDSDYELLKKQIEEAEEKIDQYKDTPKTSNSINKNCAENVEYTISIVKAGGNYDYGSEG